MLNEYQVMRKVEGKYSASVDLLRKQYGCRVVGILQESIKLCFGQTPFDCLSVSLYVRIAKITNETTSTISHILETIMLLGTL